MHILCIFPGTIDNMIVHLNLPLGGKSPYKWQNNVVGSLRCSTEEKAGLRAWSRGRESGKRGRVCVYGKRESVQAGESVWRGREGGKRKSVSASLLTAPGLRDSSSPRFPRCRFNSIPSVRSSFFFGLAIRAASDCFISSPLSARQDRTILFFLTKTSSGIAKGAFLQKDGGKTAVSSGTPSLASAAVVDFPVLLRQCFVWGSRQTVGVIPLTSARFKGPTKMTKLVLSHTRGGLSASDRCSQRRWKFAGDLHAAKWSLHISRQASATGLQRSQNERSAELFSRPLLTPGEPCQLPARQSGFSPTHFCIPLFPQLAERQVRTYWCKV